MAAPWIVYRATAGDPLFAPTRIRYGGQVLPTGTVTFLFTDLEDSTRLWERDPEIMRAAVARHDELLLACIERHDGKVVKSTGDGVMAAFADASQAVSAAVDGQRALGAETWSLPIAVRMGLHSGTAQPTDNDYHAPAVNRAARVAAAAHPGPPPPA